MKKQKFNKHFIMGIIISICCLAAVYLGISVYFVDRFYFGTTVNCINVAGETVEEAEKHVSDEVNSYIIKLEGRNSFKGEIKGSDINLKYDMGDKMKELKNNETPFGWIIALFAPNKHRITDIVSFDEKLLKEHLEQFSCVNGKDIVEPKNPTFEYADGEFKIIDEVKGCKLDKDLALKKLKDAISYGEKDFDFDKAECYVEPKYTVDSEEVKKAKEVLDKYAVANVSYTFGDSTEVVDGSLISSWLDVDDNFNVTFNEKKVAEYVNTLAVKYNTVGKERDFVTSIGTAIKIGGGSYGTAIDKTKQTKQIIDDVKSGEKKSKEAIYSQKAFGNLSGTKDIGNTYVEVDLGSQHLWYYKNGQLVTEGNIVSGCVANGTATPSGVYKLNYKERNATLKGQGYSTPVSYWMPFNGGIGIHDATWRGAFGGSIYRTAGSHGCVNAPYTLAQTIFSNIEAGTPIVCYY